MNFVLNSLVIAGLPALLAGILWLLGGQFRTLHLWLSTLAVGGGMTLIYFLMLGSPQMPPIDAQSWVFWLGFGLMPLGWLISITPAYRWVAGWVLLLTLPWVFVMLFTPIIRSEHWSLTVGIAWILVFGVELTILAYAVPLSESHLSGWQMAFLLAMLGGISAGIMFYGAKSASFAQMAGSLGAVVGIGVPLGLWMRAFRVGRGAIALAVLLYGVIWALGFAYASLPGAYLAVFPLCMMALIVPATPLARGWSPAMRFLVLLVALLVLGGGAVGVSYQAYMSASAGYDYSY